MNPLRGVNFSDIRSADEEPTIFDATHMLEDGYNSRIDGGCLYLLKMFNSTLVVLQKEMSGSDGEKRASQTWVPDMVK